MQYPKLHCFGCLKWCLVRRKSSISSVVVIGKLLVVKVYRTDTVHYQTHHVGTTSADRWSIPYNHWVYCGSSAQGLWSGACELLLLLFLKNSFSSKLVWCAKAFCAQFTLSNTLVRCTLIVTPPKCSFCLKAIKSKK